MADDHVDMPDPMEGAEAVGGEPAAAEPVAEPSVARPGLAWQFPLIAVSAVAIAAAMVMRRPEPPAIDPASELRQAREAIRQDDLERGAAGLARAAEALADHPELLAEYHLAVAEHRAAALKPLLSAPAGQARQVVEAFERARRDGAELTVAQRRDLAESLVAAGRPGEAGPLLAEIEPAFEGEDRNTLRALRHEIVRREVEAGRAAGAPWSSFVDPVARLMDDQTSLGVDAWAVAMDARIRLEIGPVEGLARGLGLEMHRLEGRMSERDPGVDAPIDWAEFWVLLGHAYRVELEAADRAAECYRIALDRLRAVGETAAEASLSLGSLQLASARELEDRRAALEEATARFDAVLGMVESSLDQRVAAEVGLVTVHLVREDDHEALLGLDRVGALLEGVSLVGDAVRGEAVAIALEGADRAMQAANVAQAVSEESRVLGLLDAASEFSRFVERFAGTAADRHRGLEFKAAARERAAMLLISPILGEDDPRVDRAVAIVPVETRLEAARRFADAAAALDEIERDLDGDDPGRFDVLWRAAVLHDKAGAVDEALRRYERFVESQSTDAAMWPEAAYRVAAARHAIRDLDDAETWYRRVITTMADGRDEINEFTMRARVGLARVLRERGGDVPMAEAEALLNEVLDGTARDAVEPSVPEYREALFQLVRLLGEQGRWNQLAGRGEEWLARYVDDPRWGEMAVRTGEGLLRHADDLSASETSGDVMNPGLAAAREEERRRALGLAAMRIQSGLSELDRVGGEDLDPLQASLLRSGFLHRAMVADRLGDPDAAIRHYRETEQRFAGESVAIVALISLADVAERSGDRETAGRATARARKRLEHLHRAGKASGLEDTLLGPDLLLGPGQETVDRWITAFPPGIEEGIG